MEPPTKTALSLVFVHLRHAAAAATEAQQPHPKLRIRRSQAPAAELPP